MHGGNPFAYLVDTLFHLYAMALLLRLLLQLVRAGFGNPLARALVTITNPVLVPLRRVLPGIGGVDVATVVAILMIKGAGIWIAAAIAGSVLPVPVLLLATAWRVLDMVLVLFMVTIVVEVILSWVSPGHYNPTSALLAQLNAPLLRPVRRLLPPLGGLDLSPLFVLIALQFLRMTLLWLL